MKKIALMLSIIIAILFGFGVGVGIKKTETIFVHKQCINGECLSDEDAYYIEQGLDDIRYYVENIKEGNKSQDWLEYIKLKSEEIEELVK